MRDKKDNFAFQEDFGRYSAKALVLILGLLFFLTKIGYSESVRVKKWEQIGTYQVERQGGNTETYLAIQVTTGVMDGFGRISYPRVSRDSILTSSPNPAYDFFQAQSGVWFVEDYWNFRPEPPPIGYNIPRGLEVVASYPHHASNWRYDVVAVTKAGSLRFQLEPQDASVKGRYDVAEVRAEVLAPPGDLTVQWLEVTPSGNLVPKGISYQLIGTNIRDYLPTGDYYLTVSDGKKTIRSRLVRIHRKVDPHEDIVDPEEGLGEIGGRVWHDENQNDIEDGEEGIAGIEVTLLEPSGRRIVARATTNHAGYYQFKETAVSGYVVRWQVPERYVVCHPFVGDDPAVDCDAASASSLVDFPTSGGPVGVESAPISVGYGELIEDVDLGLIEKPKIFFPDFGTVVLETDSDVIYEIPFKISKAVRYSRLNMPFLFWSGNSGTATELEDYEQDGFATIRAGETEGVIRLVVIGDEISESLEIFYIEPDRFLNRDLFDCTGKLDVHQVLIVDDEFSSDDSSIYFDEYRTETGNTLRVLGYTDLLLPEHSMWQWDPGSSVTGFPSFSFATGSDGISGTMAAPWARGPRSVSFDWRLQGNPQDQLTVYSSDPNNADPADLLIHGQISGSTGWQTVSLNLAEGRTFGIDFSKWSPEEVEARFWIRDLNLGGPDEVDVQPQPVSVELPELAEIEDLQMSKPPGGRILGFPSAGGNGVYSGTLLKETFSEGGAISKLSVSRKGTVAGNVDVGEKKRRFRGAFGSDGKFSTTVASPSGDTAEVMLQMQTDLRTGVSEIIGVIESSDGSTAKVVSQKPAKWIRRISPCPFEGRYTLILPQRAAGAPHAPSGDGFAAMNVSPTGRVNITGFLGDGTRFAVGTTVTPEGRVPIEKQLYRGKGGLSGVLYLRELEDTSDLDGTLRWLKPQNPRSKFQPGGFDLEVEAIGSRFDGQVLPLLSHFEGESPWALVAIFSGGDFWTTPASVLLELRRKGRNHILRETAFPSSGQPAQLLRGNINHRTGLVRFTFVDRASKQRAVGRGVVFQQQNRIAGFLTGKQAIGSFLIQ